MMEYMPNHSSLLPSSYAFITFFFLFVLWVFSLVLSPLPITSNVTDKKKKKWFPFGYFFSLIHFVFTSGLRGCTLTTLKKIFILFLPVISFCLIHFASLQICILRWCEWRLRKRGYLISDKASTASYNWSLENFSSRRHQNYAKWQRWASK